MQNVNHPSDESPLQQRIRQQRAMLYNMLVDPMQQVASRCSELWGNKEAMDQLIQMSIPIVPYVTFLYVLDIQARQISANASMDGLVQKDFGRDRSQRPYIRQFDQNREMGLSDAYISLRANRPSVTAIQKIHQGGQHIGYLGADFDLRALPITKEIYTDPSRWRQMKGDPAIRSHLFEQKRIQSRLDDNIDLVISVVDELISENGIFHLKIHFSSSRATIWTLDDPYRYQVIQFDDLVDPDICLAYPHRNYPKEAVIPKKHIRAIFTTFKHLRLADETIYLRAGSVNIFNGIVGLNFSCDGSHYIPFDQFLAKDSAFWEGM
jgi:hypothetical protein